MGYAVYEDRWHTGRWAGYAVPAVCDMPDCQAEIDHGMAFLCEEHTEYVYKLDGVVVETSLSDWDTEEEVEHEGCFHYFCEEHLHRTEEHQNALVKPDVPKWSWWLLNAPSWEKWREEASEGVLAWHHENASHYEPDQEMLDEVAYDSPS